MKDDDVLSKKPKNAIVDSAVHELCWRRSMQFRISFVFCVFSSLTRSGNALSMERLDCQFWTTEMTDVLLKLAAKKQIRTFEKAKGGDHVQDQTYSSPKLVKKTR
jgi:hypothetical protein